jgi:hypothetical protein
LFFSFFGEKQNEGAGSAKIGRIRRIFANYAKVAKKIISNALFDGVSLQSSLKYKSFFLSLSTDLAPEVDLYGQKMLEFARYLS